MASLKTLDQLKQHLDSLDIQLPIDPQVDSGSDSPLGKGLEIEGHRIGNRFSILPMEGWDGTTDGKPTDLTRRRWRNFGISGAKWIWGGEAVAVRHDGRANPNQLLMTEENLSDLESLRGEMITAHTERFGTTDDFFDGLQITHSGRFARPNEKKLAEPRTIHRNPPLDRRMNITDDSTILSDDELKTLEDEFIAAAVRAQKIGFSFVDVKHCHGYLGHEVLAAVDRPGPYGGSLENRTRFLRNIVEGIRSEAPGLLVGTRLSLFDFVPFGPGEDNVGRPEPDADPRLSFACGPDGLSPDLDQTSELLDLVKAMGIGMICTTAGVPYATPHIQRPATFPPSDGYDPPEDPLVGVVRQIHATAELKKRHPDLLFIGSGYTYLQDWLGSVGQAVVRTGMADSIGLGRMVLSYPDLPADILEGNTAQRKKICRTFSDCTTAPRNGIVSGCYPLDPFYKAMPERKECSQELKKG